MGTVKGDLHDIGKNLCIMMLRGAGFIVHDLGVDTSPEDFADGFEEHEPHVIGMSALLTTTMPNMGRTIQYFEDIGLIKNFLVIGIINKNPTISVKNPGNISKKAAKANAAPEMISYTGISFFTNWLKPDFNVLKPANFAK